MGFFSDLKEDLAQAVSELVPEDNGKVGKIDEEALLQAAEEYNMARVRVEKVQEQAKAYGHSEKREFAFLIVHSMLHLFGYDHMPPEDAAIMEPKQREILEAMNISREE